MSNRFEGSFRGHDQLELFFQVWTTPKPRGTIVLTHGLAEHSECYSGLAKLLVQEGWEVYGWDMRGHGRSEGKRGFTRGFSDFVSDFKIFVEMVAKKRTNTKLPLVLFAHSLGGLVTLRAAAEWTNPPFQALALSSPLLGIAVEVPKIKDKVARIAHRWLPSLTLHNEIRYSDLTRDQSMIKTYDQDVLRHDKISPAVYIGMVEESQWMMDHASSITEPVHLQLAGVDRIVSTPIAQDFFAHLPNQKNVIHLYPESMHEIYNDLDRDQAFADLKQFLNQFQVTQ